MAREINIDLDVASVATAKAREDVSRLALVAACGYTKDGGAPTITADCKSYAAIKREAERLKDEIDAALERAAVHYGKRAEASAPAQRPEPAAAGPSARARIDSGLHVRDVMTTMVRTLGPNDMLVVADELMNVGHFRHAVVVAEERVCGVISRRDIFHGALAWTLGQGAAAHRKLLETLPVKQVMQTDVVTIEPDRTLADAARLMIERKLGCLPVVDADRLVGLLTEGDFVALLTGS